MQFSDHVILHILYDYVPPYLSSIHFISPSFSYPPPVVNKAKIFRRLMEEGGASWPALVQQGIGGKIVEQGHDEPVALEINRSTETCVN